MKLPIVSFVKVTSVISLKAVNPPALDETVSKELVSEL